MLGSELSANLSEMKNLEVLRCHRGQLNIDSFGRYRKTFRKLVSEFDPDYVINCVGVKGVTKAPNGILRQLIVNGIFPRYLVKMSKQYGFYVIQISTDGVFFGKRGGYDELTRKYPRSIYSLSKILGEKESASVLIIRCSIIGKSPLEQNSLSLFSWFQNLKQDSYISGYTNQRWNGVTTYYLAKLILGIIETGYHVGGVQHFIPSDTLSKAELLGIFRNVLHRFDVSINPVIAKKNINRELTTRNPKTNLLFWNIAGLEKVPTISKMVESSFSQELPT